MLSYILAPQIDSSDQTLKLVSANITGTLFHIEDRAAGIAVGVEHRLYDGKFNPDPLRQIGESQDSLAFPVSASYHVNELYSEFSFPLLRVWVRVPPYATRITRISATRRPTRAGSAGSPSRTLRFAAPIRQASAPEPRRALRAHTVRRHAHRSVRSDRWWRYRPEIRGGLHGTGRTAGVYASQHPDHTFTAAT